MSLFYDVVEYVTVLWASDVFLNKLSALLPVYGDDWDLGWCIALHFPVLLINILNKNYMNNAFYFDCMNRPNIKFIYWQN